MKLILATMLIIMLPLTAFGQLKSSTDLVQSFTSFDSDQFALKSPALMLLKFDGDNPPAEQAKINVKRRFHVSLIGFVVPSLVGFGLAYANEGQVQSIVGATLYGYGMLFGASSGYWGTGNSRLTKYAIWGVVIPIGITGLTALGIANNVFDLEIETLIIGGIILPALMNFVTTLLLPYRFREALPAGRLASLSIRPKLLSGADQQIRPGLSIDFAF